MNEFREWLSDNLRYLMLGAAILVLLALIGFTTHWLTTRDSDDRTEQSEEQQMEQPAEEEKEENDQEQDMQETAEPTDEPEAQEEEEKQLQIARYEAVDGLIQSYYAALGSRDVEGLKLLLDQLDPEEADRIVNSPYIEGYSNVKIVLKEGYTKESYVVFAQYDHKYVGYDTLLPGVSCLYVDTKEDGKPYVVAEPSPEQQKWMEQVMEAQDIQMFLSAKQKEYETVLESDPELQAFLNGLGA